MGRISAVWRFLNQPFVSVVVLAALGVAAGYLVFFYVYPHKPKIGVIEIPFTVIVDRSANTITDYLEYARQDDSIKGVIIRLNTPGGAAASSERLYFETRKLREEKPVVMIMGDLVASGGYMMSMGANYLYAKPSSLVGNVGVIISFPGPLIPPPPTENLVITGPSKIFGGDRRQWVTMADEMKHAFGGIVEMERRGKLTLRQEELLTGRIFSGIEGVNVGLVDEIGAESDALDKVADLAGISNYELVDINSIVQRKSNETLRWVFDPLLLDFQNIERQPQAAPSLVPGSSSQDALAAQELIAEGRLAPSFFGADGTPLSASDNEALRNILPYGGVGQGQSEALPGFPRQVNHPNIYYLYVGPTQ